MGRRRTLMVLSVLSGERPVTEVIAQAQISRGTYYQLEERALRAMIAALTPTSSASADEDSTQIAESPARTIAALQTKLARLERIKRRQERMLLMTRKLVKTGPMTSGAGRPRKKPSSPRRSTSPGPKPSRGSTPSETKTAAASIASSTMKDGEVGR